MQPRKRYFPRKAQPLPPPAAPRDRRELDAVRDVVHASVSGESAEESLQFALDRVAPLLGAALGSVYLLDGASELMRLVAAHQWPEKFRPWLGSMRVRVGFGPSGEAASERRVIDVPDVFADPDLEDWHDVARELGVTAITALPLVAAGRVLGVATFYFREASDAASESRTLLRLVADLMAVTAEQAAKRDELRRVNAALLEANAEVERQYEAAGRSRQTDDALLDGVARELRLPLSALDAGLTRGEVEAPAAPENVTEGDELRALRSQATRALGLVDALLDFTEARRGAPVQNLDEFDPRAPMHDAVRGAEALREGASVSAVEPLLALPPMRGDRRKVVRLLLTLIEHLLLQGRTLCVEVTVDAGDGRALFRVQESGGRLTPSVPERYDGAAAAPHDWALELARGVGRAMGGDVTADAAGDGRAAFTLELPLDGPPGADQARG